MTGDFAGLRELNRKFVDLATPGSEGERTILQAVKKTAKPTLAKQYRGGAPIDGGSWPQRKAGGAAMQSKRLASAIKLIRRPGGLVVVYLVDWLRAHDEGHTFKARTAGGQRLTFAVNGKRISDARAQRRKLVFDVFTKEHAIGVRVLPPRRQYPRSISSEIENALVRGLRQGMVDWHRGGAR